MNTTASPPRNHSRRGLIKLVGASAALLGVLAAGCAPSDRETTSSPTPSVPTPSLAAGDPSNGADNFYTSDRVTVQQVRFKNQYQMNVTGNLSCPTT